MKLIFLKLTASRASSILLACGLKKMKGSGSTTQQLLDGEEVCRTKTVKKKTPPPLGYES
jgi:hypothetical protein